MVRSPGRVTRVPRTEGPVGCAESFVGGHSIVLIFDGAGRDGGLGAPPSDSRSLLYVRNVRKKICREKLK